MTILFRVQVQTFTVYGTAKKKYWTYLRWAREKLFLYIIDHYVIVFLAILKCHLGQDSPWIIKYFPLIIWVRNEASDRGGSTGQLPTFDFSIFDNLEAAFLFSIMDCSDSNSLDSDFQTQLGALLI